MDIVRKREKSMMAVSPGLLLRLEGAALLLLAIFLYRQQSASWILFLLLVLAPDIGAVGYLVNTRAGARTYNALHSTVGPLLLAAAGFWLAQPLALQLALIWLAHIGLDRMLGFGLKYDDEFSHTHLGEV